MSRTCQISVLAAVCTIVGACGSPAANPEPQVVEQSISDPNSVGFNIEPLNADGETQLWLAMYTSQGKTAKFRIRLGSAKALEGKESKNFDRKQGEGKILAEPNSDANVLLGDLKEALEANKIPTKVRNLRVLPFVYLALGDHNSKAIGGGCNAEPRVSCQFGNSTITAPCSASIPLAYFLFSPHGCH